jgi:CubicO group peptidase (beta-lactamase class C family)
MSTDFDGVRSALHALVRDSKTPGLQYVAVDRSTTLLQYHEGFADIAARRPMTGDTTMMAYSMSKTITAAAVLRLVEAGEIGLDHPVSRYLAWQPYGDEITVRQLLSHTSGTPNPLPLRWVHPISRHDGFDERAALDVVLRSHPRLAFRPGTKYAYSNIGYWLLGGVVERASGLPFTSYVTRNVLQPLDIEPHEIAYTLKNPATHATGYLEKYSLINFLRPCLVDRELVGASAGRWLQIRDHYVNGPAYGGLVGNALGFSRFLQDQLREHSRLFGDKTRALLVEPQRTAAGHPVPMTLGWHMRSTDVARYLFKEGGGGFHCMMRLYPVEGVGTVLMTNATGIGVSAVLDAIDRQTLQAR